MGDVKRAFKGSYDSMRKTMGLKGPGKGAIERKKLRRQMDPLDEEQIEAIQSQLGPTSPFGRNQPGRRGRPNSIYDTGGRRVRGL